MTEDLKAVADAAFGDDHRKRRSRAGDVCRRRKPMAFLTLAMLLYGKHSSVAWLEDYHCVIRTPLFARAILIDSTQLRQHMEWLKRQKYLEELKIGHGYIEARIKRPMNRAPLDQGEV